MDCMCHKQIVFFFDQPTVIVCPTCEKTFHTEDKICYACDGDLVHFTANWDDVYPPEEEC